MSLKSMRGFSLPELMVAVAISGVVALGVSKLMTDTQKNQSYIETLAEINKAVALAQTTLANKTNCNTTFSLFTNATNFSPGQALSGLRIRNAGTGAISEILKTGDYGRYAITSITVKNNPANVKVKDVEFLFNWKNRAFMSTATIKKIVSIFAEVDPGNDGILGTADSTDPWVCGGVVRDAKLDSQEALCTSLGAEFAAWGTPIAGKCNIKEFKCPAGQVPTTITSLGKVICVATATTLDLNALIETAPVACPAGSANIRIEFTAGKYRLNCSGGCSPVAGGWTAWSWGSCDGTSRTGTRTCTNPSPSCGGATCSGPSSTTEGCSCLATGTYCDASPGELCTPSQGCSACCLAPLGTCTSGAAYEWGRCNQVPGGACPGSIACE